MVSPLRTTRLPPAVQADVIEQIYHDGTLYRVDAPRISSPRRATVPTPHIQLPPRTSPRRNVRRSMLQLLGHQGVVATPMPVEPPSRQASGLRQLPGAPRQGVEGDHTGRLTPPARQELPPARRSKPNANLRPTPTLADIVRQLPPPPAPLPLPREPQVELSPEVIIDAPQADEPWPTKLVPLQEPKFPTPVVAPAIAPPPSVAPLNLAQYTWYRPATDIINNWAKEYIEISNSPTPLEVKGSRPFTLKPW